VEKAAFLVPVQGIVGGVQIEDDPLRRPLVGLQVQLHEQVLHGSRVVADLVIPGRGSGRGVFQPVQGALAGQRRAVVPLRLQPLRQQRQNRIVAQLVMVVDILVTQRNPGDPLAHHHRQTVNHQLRPPLIVEASRDPGKQPDRPIRMSEQQGPAIRTHRPAIERRHHTAPIEPFKIILIGDTLCSHRLSFQNLVTLCSKRTLQDSRGRCTPYGEIFRLDDRVGPSSLMPATDRLADNEGRKTPTKTKMTVAACRKLAGSRNTGATSQ